MRSGRLCRTESRAVLLGTSHERSSHPASSLGEPDPRRHSLAVPTDTEHSASVLARESTLRLLTARRRLTAKSSRPRHESRVVHQDSPKPAALPPFPAGSLYQIESLSEAGAIAFERIARVFVPPGPMLRQRSRSRRTHRSQKRREAAFSCVDGESQVRKRVLARSEP